MTWIRVESNTPENDKVIALAEGCGLSAEAATGFLVRWWGRIAEHRPDGDLRGMSDDALERWAGWNGMPTVFAGQLRKLFIRNGCVVNWVERQGKLAARAVAERDRKRASRGRGPSADIPPLRNGTSTTNNRGASQDNGTPWGHYLAEDWKGRIDPNKAREWFALAGFPDAQVSENGYRNVHAFVKSLERRRKGVTP